MQDTDLEYERYKDFDFSGATRTKNPKILEMQARKKAHDDLVSFFDSDVQEVIKQHNTPQDRMRVNQMIRLLFATA
ncbi:hypothetical protein [Glaesserella sp.]|uniref:hypothetical protein n=1 Tax=Glaesserella sp. TaxID=2094731 RepID=UPI0035A02FBC